MIKIHYRVRTTRIPGPHGDLADVSPEFESLVNVANPKTRHAYKLDVSEFSALAASLSAYLANGQARPWIA